VIVNYSNEDVGICLDAQPTRKAAMLHGIEWAKNYIKNGPPSADDVFKDCFIHYPSLFKTRTDVIDQLFFVVGGYSWLDGAIINTTPEDYIESQRRKERDKTDPNKIKMMALFREILNRESTPEEHKEELRRILHEDDEPKFRPLPDDGGPRRFYPVSKNYSNITRVPDEVRPDWLAVTYEAAILLRDRSGVPEGKQDYYTDVDTQKEHRILGAKIVENLERRFPQLKNAS
jgi:hypothetical protein